MSSPIGPPRSDAELDVFANILRESLNFQGGTDFLRERYDPADLRLLRRGGRVVGGLVLLRVGQFFSGERVAMAGVHAVAIAPEARGSGAGRELMTHVMGELAGPGGPPISALFPATQPLYRSVGFEQAGTLTRYRIPVSSIPVGPHDLEVERLPADPAAVSAVVGDLYRRIARRTNGFIDRSPWFWQRSIAPRTPVDAYCVREAGAVTGYLVLGRRWPGHGLPHWELSCREMLSETPAAERRLWTLLADERSLARSLLLTGPPSMTGLLGFLEQTAEVESQIAWMLRVVDVEAALAGRGFPGRAGRVVLEVEDDLVARNRGRFALELDGGRARVQRTDEQGQARLSIRGLAALYSGHHTAERLAAAGLVSGSPDALAGLTALFAAPPPWLGEFF